MPPLGQEAWGQGLEELWLAQEVQEALMRGNNEDYFMGVDWSGVDRNIKKKMLFSQRYTSKQTLLRYAGLDAQTTASIWDEIRKDHKSL